AVRCSSVIALLQTKKPRPICGAGAIVSFRRLRLRPQLLNALGKLIEAARARHANELGDGVLDGALASASSQRTASAVAAQPVDRHIRKLTGLLGCEVARHDHAIDEIDGEADALRHR